MIEDILSVTGISKKIQTFDSLQSALHFCHEHFRHIIEFVLKQKEEATRREVELKMVQEGAAEFFSDTDKNIPNVERILSHSFNLNASDIHLQAGKCITYRVE